ncbi:6-bladed beta-propeller [Algoriphagus aestuarii]|nr:6-bladed beta-propeller [Algoriphagus aestuarii]
MNTKYFTLTFRVLRTLYIINLVSLFSCENPKENISNLDNNLIEIGINPLEYQEFNLDSVYKSISYFPLAMRDEMPISYVNALIEFDKKLIVISERILVFDNEGNFINEIGKRGEGPGEYSALTRVRRIDNEVLDILDNESGKIITYNISGDLIEEWKNPELLMALDFNRLNDDTYAVYGGTFFESKSGYRLLLIDKTDNSIVNSFFPLIGNEARFAVFLDNNSLWHSKGNLNFTYSFKDTIFYFSENKLVPRFYLNYGDKKFPKEVYTKGFPNVMEFLNFARNSNYAYYSTNVLENNEILFFTYEYEGYLHQSFYSTKRKELDKFRLYSVKENRTEDIFYFLNYPKGISDKYIYFFIEPEEYMYRMNVLKERGLLSSNFSSNILKTINDLGELISSTGSVIIIKAELF